ncbi:hypothetical protein N8J89_16560 [Crossiella sp. CA-258035]|uniref:hypothetical protein n=1 Tax=Crossiella sp. CA-258035 TaxID=2981138 RepID=UPI0024BC509F|nr:hypothetical protein [Crossiella sp. CA-258035]WHT22611.1 hypothetical protein N8J89_16560 [Crossiella sp. CA-258035]
MRLDSGDKTCLLQAGVSGDQDLELSLSASLGAKPLYPNACEKAREIVAAMLRNIPAVW